VEDWVAGNPTFEFLAKDKAIRSNTSVCVNVSDPSFAALSGDEQTARIKKIAKALEQEQVAFDVAGYRDAPAGFRFWCGPTVDAEDLSVALEWVAWATETVE
jgi:phosphoserine aminotransferase